MGVAQLKPEAFLRVKAGVHAGEYREAAPRLLGEVRRRKRRHKPLVGGTKLFELSHALSLERSV